MPRSAPTLAPRLVTPRRRDQGIGAIILPPSQSALLSFNSGVTRRNPPQALDRYPLILDRDP
jgi:hypothetical protein